MTRNAALLTRKGFTLVPIILLVPTGMLDRLVPLNCGMYPMAVAVWSELLMSLLYTVIPLK